MRDLRLLLVGIGDGSLWRRLGLGGGGIDTDVITTGVINV
jgi:hypothetical protein